MTKSFKWQPIRDLEPELWSFKNTELHSLVSVWGEQRQRLNESGTLAPFLERLVRQVAIETGLIEKLYSIERGITHVMIEQGIDAALIPHGATDKPIATVVALIRDQQSAVEQVFNFVGANRALSTSFIKQLHQLLTKNQETTTAVDPFGNLGEVELLKGDWKRTPNNVHRQDGTTHEYCPPEHVTAEMDRLIAWHSVHLDRDIAPEVEAAWLHHRFTQIHPFQDGNGRVARNLATLVFLRAGWFPLIVLPDPGDDSGRVRYIEALEAADRGELMPLIDLFAKSQQRAFLGALSLSETVLSERQTVESLINSALNRLRASGIVPLSERRQLAEERADSLVSQTSERLTWLRLELESSFRTAGYMTQTLRVHVDEARNGTDRSPYFRQQIISIARGHDYFANLSGYIAWVRLRIVINSVTTHVILSFHELGHDNTGVMAVSAFAFRKTSGEEASDSTWHDLEPLSELPFNFSYLDDLGTLTTSFGIWLEDVLKLALIYWQKGI